MNEYDNNINDNVNDDGQWRVSAADQSSSRRRKKDFSSAEIRKITAVRDQKEQEKEEATG